VDPRSGDREVARLFGFAAQAAKHRHGQAAVAVRCLGDLVQVELALDGPDIEVVAVLSFEKPADVVCLVVTSLAADRR
jgi:hypothetical protein